MSCLWFRFMDSFPVSMTHLHSFFSFSFVFLSHTSLKKFFFFSDSSPLTSLSWLLMVSRVTGLLGLLLLSLTEATCPFLMIGTVASAWPGVCGWGTAWPCPPEEANFEPSVKYCFTCWFWVWWRWNLEFSRWLCTYGRRQKRLWNCSFQEKQFCPCFSAIFVIKHRGWWWDDSFYTSASEK